MDSETSDKFMSSAIPVPVESTVFPSELSVSRSNATTEKLSSSPVKGEKVGESETQTGRKSCAISQAMT